MNVFFFFAMGGLLLLGEVVRWSYTMGVFNDPNYAVISHDNIDCGCQTVV